MDLLRVAVWIETNIVLVLQYNTIYIYNIIQYNYILYTILSMIDYVRFCGIIIIVSLVVGACKAMDNPTSLGVWLAKDTGNRPQFGTWWFPIETSIEFCAFAWILHGFPAIRMNMYLIIGGCIKMIHHSTGSGCFLGSSWAPKGQRSGSRHANSTQ